MAGKKQFGVLIAPHARLAGASHETWPRPSRVTVRFTNTADPGDVRDRETGPEGLANADLKPDVPYAVELVGDEWKSWRPEPPTLTVPARQSDPIDLTLVPRDDLCLVALRLCRQRRGAGAVAGAVVRVRETGGGQREFRSLHDGSVFATASQGDITLEFEAHTVGGEHLVPWDISLPYQAAPDPEVEVEPIVYLSTIRITVKPTVEDPKGGKVPLALTGARVTVAYRGSELADADTKEASLAAGKQEVPFEFRFPGVFQVTVKPPAVIDGWPVDDDVPPLEPRSLRPGGTWNLDAHFKAVAREDLHGTVVTPSGKPLDRPLALQFSGAGGIDIRRTTVAGGAFVTDAPAGIDLNVQLDAKAGQPAIERIPVEMPPPGHQDLVRGEDIIIELQYQHAITGNAVDEAGNPVPAALIDVFNDQQARVRTVVADAKGYFTVGLPRSGDYYVAVRTTDGGETVTRTAVSVHSVMPLPRPLVVRSFRTGAPSPQFPREAFTDLASYPVLTEEVTTGGGFPAPGGTVPGGDYGQAVDQVIRDVLGWRPSADVAGFQAALTGAFALRDVDGHTEWTWQQRGYSVQADMGALTGAQASIYARAKSALDQMQPLLAGLTTLNPSVSTPEEREAIRTVVTTEITELVTELSFQGGPRIQRVDELFTLLTGQGVTSIQQKPDRVSGHLHTLRQRFALTVDNVDTVDDERVLTNFRIVVEQVLALQTGWQSDRKLLSGVGPDTSLGTLLIWLSRSLEAVGDSVDELNFTLDSVFIDAAQRQVVELRFAEVPVELPDLPLKDGATKIVTFPRHEPPILLSDLLDWVTRATRDEGPRLIQDAGKDGVMAFAAVLDKLRLLVRAIRSVRTPAGLRTPRVHRAISVLAGQLDEAANLAKLVQPSTAPTIFIAWWAEFHPDALRPPTATRPPRPLPTKPTSDLWIELLGTNFRYPARAVLTAVGRPDLPALYEHAMVCGPDFAYAKITNPGALFSNPGTAWAVSLINGDGTQSNEYTL